jgi:hypothetical protein
MPVVRYIGRKEVRIGTYYRSDGSGGLSPVRGRVAACTQRRQDNYIHCLSQEHCRLDHTANQAGRSKYSKVAAVTN